MSLTSRSTTTPADFWSDFGDLLEARMEAMYSEADVPDRWREWLEEMFPGSVRAGFGDHHRAFWQWLWDIGQDRPPPFVGIWPRGGGKSTSVELGVTALGARDIRRYAVIVSETRDQANKRVENIATLLESESMNHHYPAMADRAVSKFGRSKAWRRSRLWTASGFLVDGLGLDQATRGLKAEDQRPDIIVLDDIDGRHDTENSVAKKIKTITDTILPMGTRNTAVIAVQNLIIPHGVFAKLASGEADFLIDRVVSGPVKAVENLKTEREHLEDGRVRHVVVGGDPSWEGQNLEIVQDLLDGPGLKSFLREQQHEVDEVEGALWTRKLIKHVQQAPTMKRVVVGVDPSGGRAEIGIVAAGLGHDGLVYVLVDATQPGKKGALNWGNVSVDTYDDLEGDRIVAEKNFGGDMVKSNIEVAAGDRYVPVELVHSSRGKEIRADPVVSLYEDGRALHVGVHPELETEMTRWVPGVGDSPNRVDALVFAVTELVLTKKKPMTVSISGRKKK